MGTEAGFGTGGRLLSAWASTLLAVGLTAWAATTEHAIGVDGLAVVAILAALLPPAAMAGSLEDARAALRETEQRGRALQKALDAALLGLVLTEEEAKRE